MGQSFLTHDEKSSVGSPSPDLLQFNGVSSQPKFFGSLSSDKETSISSSSRSALESESERNNLASSSSASPYPQASSSTDQLYCSLVPTPILPGNVNRLREKFMDFDRSRGKGGSGKRYTPTSGNVSIYKGGVLSDLDCRFTRPATTSPRISIGTLPSTSPSSRSRSRSSLYTLSRNARRKHGHPVYEKLDVIRSDNDLSECFRQMGISTCTNNKGNFTTSEVPLGRHRPRTRPYVPPPRSVIIRAGYLPVLQTVDLLPAASGRASWTSPFPQNNREEEEDALDSANARVLLSSCNIPEEESRSKTEDFLLGNSNKEERSSCSTVTNQGDHTPKVLVKDAETNTSAEVLVLPKGVKTSVVLTADVGGKGKGKLRKRKKKRVFARVSRAFGRIMVRLVELF